MNSARFSTMLFLQSNGFSIENPRAARPEPGSRSNIWYRLRMKMLDIPCVIHLDDSNQSEYHHSGSQHTIAQRVAASSSHASGGHEPYNVTPESRPSTPTHLLDYHRGVAQHTAEQLREALDLLFPDIPVEYQHCWVDSGHAPSQQLQEMLDKLFTEIPVEYPCPRVNPEHIFTKPYLAYPGQIMNPYQGDFLCNHEQSAEIHASDRIPEAMRIETRGLGATSNREKRSEYLAYNPDFDYARTPTQGQQCMSARGPTQQHQQVPQVTHPDLIADAPTHRDHNASGLQQVRRRAVGAQPAQQQTNSHYGPRRGAARAQRPHNIQNRKNPTPSPKSTSTPTCNPTPSHVSPPAPAPAPTGEVELLQPNDPAHLTPRNPLYQHPELTLRRNMRDVLRQLFGREKKVVGFKQLAYQY